MAYIDGNQVLFSTQINGIVNIDDAMSDDSENPVQNKVVKKYVDDATGQQEWELIYEVETTETVSQISQRVDTLSDTSKGVRVALYIPPNTTLKSDRVSLTASLAGTNSLAVYASNWTAHTAQTLCVFEVKPKDLVWDIDVAPYTKVFNKVEGNGAGTDINPVVRYATLKTGDGFPAGTIMKVWRLK